MFEKHLFEKNNININIIYILILIFTLRKELII